MGRLKHHGIAARAITLFAILTAAGVLTIHAQQAAPRINLDAGINVDAKVLKNAGTSQDALQGDWLAYGRSLSETRFSPLHQIDTSNVSRLGLSESHGHPCRPHAARTIDGHDRVRQPDKTLDDSSGQQMHASARATPPTKSHDVS